MKSWNYEFDHLKDYLFLESYLLDVLSRDQLLHLLANLTRQICQLITLGTSLCNDKCTSYHTNQVSLTSPHPNWLHTFIVLESFLHFYVDNDACAIFH